MTPGGRWAVLGAISLVLIGTAAVVILAITGDLNTNSTPVMTIIGLIVSAVPALIAAGFAKQAAHDIRNGVVTQKAAEGAVQALNETGVTAVAQGASSANALAMQALARLLETNTTAMNTAATNRATDQAATYPRGGTSDG